MIMSWTIFWIIVWQMVWAILFYIWYSMEMRDKKRKPMSFLEAFLVLNFAGFTPFIALISAIIPRVKNRDDKDK